jgi:hypothetical protein
LSLRARAFSASLEAARPFADRLQFLNGLGSTAAKAPDGGTVAKTKGLRKKCFQHNGIHEPSTDTPSRDAAYFILEMYLLGKKAGQAQLAVPFKPLILLYYCEKLPAVGRTLYVRAGGTCRRTARDPMRWLMSPATSKAIVVRAALS